MSERKSFSQNRLGLKTLCNSVELFRSPPGGDIQPLDVVKARNINEKGVGLIHKGLVLQWLLNMKARMQLPEGEIFKLIKARRRIILYLS